MSDTHQLAQKEREQAYKELNQAWDEIEKVQHSKRTVNITSAAVWLKRGEKAFSEKTPDCVTARYCMVMARYELIKAQEAAKYFLLGYLAILVEFLYLALVVVFVISLISIGTPPDKLPDTTIFHVPLYVLLWGFLGGVSWCLYSAAYWSNKHLFDTHYFPWYLANPWISAVLSGAVAMLIIGGLSAVGEFDPASTAGIAILSVTSFVVGFSTHKFWKLLDRTVAKILGVNESDSVIKEQDEKLTQQPGGSLS
jgi:hypothetical protein